MVEEDLKQAREKMSTQTNGRIPYLEWVMCSLLLLPVLYVEVIPKHEKNVEYPCMFEQFVMRQNPDYRSVNR